MTTPSDRLFLSAVAAALLIVISFLAIMALLHNPVLVVVKVFGCIALWIGAMVAGLLVTRCRKRDLTWVFPLTIITSTCAVLALVIGGWFA
jgi:hypothetical protein